MFQYKYDYEVDGSSTMYNIVLPERKLVSELIQYFLNLKIINYNNNILLRYYNNLNKTVEMDIPFNKLDSLIEIIENSVTRSFEIVVGCIHPDKLYNSVRNELYSLSKTRPGGEDLIINYYRPTVGPFGNGPYLDVTISVTFNQLDKEVDYEIEGLIFNKQSLIKNLEGRHYKINFECGPGFIYEYAAYIVSNLAERFPEIGIDGGIDCAGGFMNGCTYAAFLYQYERITILTSNIGEAINLLLNEGIILPQKRSVKFGYEIISCNDLYLFNLNGLMRSESERLSPTMKIIKGIHKKEEYNSFEYEEFVYKIAKISLLDSIEFMHACTCEIKIENETCALTCVKENNQVYLELRVVPKLKGLIEKKLRNLGFEFR